MFQVQRILDDMENNFPDACPQIIGKLTSVKIFGCVKKKVFFTETHLLKLMVSIFPIQSPVFFFLALQAITQ